MEAKNKFKPSTQNTMEIRSVIGHLKTMLAIVNPDGTHAYERSKDQLTTQVDQTIGYLRGYLEKLEAEDEQRAPWES